MKLYTWFSLNRSDLIWDRLDWFGLYKLCLVVVWIARFGESMLLGVRQEFTILPVMNTLHKKITLKKSIF